MTQQQIFDWLEHPERLNRETLCELRTLLARYPYFQTARLLYLKNLFLLHDPSFGEELRKAALYISNRRVLFYLIEGERFSPESLEVKEKPKEDNFDRTLSLIDSFLATLPDEPAVPLEIPLDVSMLTTDYTSLLLQDDSKSEENTPLLKGQALIDEFIGKQEQLENKTGQELVTGTGLDDDSEFVARMDSWADANVKPNVGPDAESNIVSNMKRDIVSNDCLSLELSVESKEELNVDPVIVSVVDPNEQSDADSRVVLKTDSKDQMAIVMSQSESTEVLPSNSSEPLVTGMSETEDSTEDDMDDESYFTETLAKIYVKQQRYSKALEIIKKLNLKYPKKNAYFADQIRFLEKLIINTKSK